MTSKVYCYHCMTYHHPETMRQMQTPRGKRWRCIRSIEAAQNHPDERDAFGERQSELNRAMARSSQEQRTFERRLQTLSC